MLVKRKFKMLPRSRVSLERFPKAFFFLCKILLWFTECHRSFVLCHTSFRICGRACDKWFCVFSGNEINAHVLVI